MVWHESCQAQLIYAGIIFFFHKPVCVNAAQVRATQHSWKVTMAKGNAKQTWVHRPLANSRPTTGQGTKTNGRGLKTVADRESETR